MNLVQFATLKIDLFTEENHRINWATAIPANEKNISTFTDGLYKSMKFRLSLKLGLGKISFN